MARKDFFSTSVLTHEDMNEVQDLVKDLADNYSTPFTKKTYQVNEIPKNNEIANVENAIENIGQKINYGAESIGYNQWVDTKDWGSGNRLFSFKDINRWYNNLDVIGSYLVPIRGIPTPDINFLLQRYNTTTDEEGKTVLDSAVYSVIFSVKDSRLRYFYRFGANGEWIEDTSSFNKFDFTFEENGTLFVRIEYNGQVVNSASMTVTRLGGYYQITTDQRSYYISASEFNKWYYTDLYTYYNSLSSYYDYDNIKNFLSYVPKKYSNKYIIGKCSGDKSWVAIVDTVNDLCFKERIDTSVSSTPVFDLVAKNAYVMYWNAEESSDDPIWEEYREECNLDTVGEVGWSSSFHQSGDFAMYSGYYGLGSKYYFNNQDIPTYLAGLMDKPNVNGVIIDYGYARYLNGYIISKAIINYTFSIVDTSKYKCFYKVGFDGAWHEYKFSSKRYFEVHLFDNSTLYVKIEDLDGNYMTGATATITKISEPVGYFNDFSKALEFGGFTTSGTAGITDEKLVLGSKKYLYYYFDDVVKSAKSVEISFDFTKNVTANGPAKLFQIIGKEGRRTVEYGVQVSDSKTAQIDGHGAIPIPWNDEAPNKFRMTYDGSNITFYINGTEIYRKQSSWVKYPKKLGFKGRLHSMLFNYTKNGASWIFDGAIDNLSVVCLDTGKYPVTQFYTDGTIGAYQESATDTGNSISASALEIHQPYYIAETSKEELKHYYSQYKYYLIMDNDWGVNTYIFTDNPEDVIGIAPFTNNDKNTVLGVFVKPSGNGIIVGNGGTVTNEIGHFMQITGTGQITTNINLQYKIIPDHTGMTYSNDYNSTNRALENFLTTEYQAVDDGYYWSDGMYILAKKDGVSFAGLYKGEFIIDKE